MSRYVISIGSNVSNRELRVGEAIDYLTALLGSAKASSVYHTPSINGDGVDYANAVVAGDSNLDVAEMDALCKCYEAEKGRVHGHDVVIDLDVVMCDSAVLRPKDAERSYFTRGYEELLADCRH